MKLTQTKIAKINQTIINKLAIVTTGICLGLMVMPATRAAELSNSPVSLQSNSAEKLLAQRICNTYRVTSRNGLYVYNGNQIIDTIPHNKIVTVTQVSSDGEWVKIYYQGGSGWVARIYLSCYQQ